MPRRITALSTSVSFSTRGSLMPAWLVQHVAAAAGIEAVDVDATSHLGAWLAARSGTTERPYVPVRSLWLPCDGVSLPRSRRLLDALSRHQEQSSPLVVLLVPTAGSLRELSRWMDPGLTSTQPSSFAIGLPSSMLKGGRPHLVQLGAIRRFAEEWELSIAVDLSGRFDPTWEAEAAIARIGDRLRVLRMTTSAPSRAAIGRDRVACRALHAAIDRGNTVSVALTCTGRAPFPVTPRGAADALRRAAEYIDERATVQAEALREGIGRFEGSHSSRGG